MLFTALRTHLPHYVHFEAATAGIAAPTRRWARTSWRPTDSRQRGRFRGPFNDAGAGAGDSEGGRPAALGLGVERDAGRCVICPASPVGLVSTTMHPAPAVED